MGDLISHDLENLSPYQEYCWYINGTQDGTTREISDTYCFRPNNVPKMLNFRIEDADANNFTVKWNNDQTWNGYLL